MSELIIVEQNELFVGTWKLSNGFGVEHRQLKRFIEMYKNEFEEFGVVAPMRINPPSKKGGRKIEEYIINEEQASYLTMLMKNNPKVRSFKRFLNKEFFKQRRLLNKLLAQKRNAEWLEKRESGKIERRLETDTIKMFVQYAKDQGSLSAEKYYMIISKMENSTLFQLDYIQQKFPNLRECVEGFQLDALKMADHTVGRALKEGMEKNMPYKDIFQLAKARVEMFASAIGKSPILSVLGSKNLINSSAQIN